MQAPYMVTNQERYSEISKVNEEWEREHIDLAMEDGTPINPSRALSELTRVLPEDAMVSTDIGNVSSTANAYLKFNRGRTALGAKVAKPDSPAVAIIGDGAWGMSLHEVSTAVVKYTGYCLCL